MDGWEWRDMHQEEREANWMSYILNVLGAKPQVTPSILLGRPVGPTRDTDR